jgi:hypothetical protein
VPEDRAAEPGRSFGTVTPALQARADGLAAGRIEAVAREATGVYGLPVEERLDARGFQVDLVHARHLTHGPGRTREVKAGQGMPSLHPCGLLRGAFRPEAERCAVPASWRPRAARLESRAAPIQHRHQALPPMTVQLPPVLTEMTGATGLAMIRAVVAGERDPVRLARLRAPRWASRTEESATALTGPEQPEPVCALKQALAR